MTQAWLAVGDDAAATGTGGYFFHQQPQQVHPATRDVAFQDELLAYCADLSGTNFPRERTGPPQAEGTAGAPEASGASTA